jgi:hypothetical protein
MDVKIQTVWTGNFSNTLSGIASFSRWLVILNLSISLTYVSQLWQWRKQGQQVKNDSTILNYPWATLKNFYEESIDSLALYNQQVATPWSQLCWITSKNFSRYQSNFDTTCVTTREREDSLAFVDTARNRLQTYCSDLTKISSAHENGVAFNDLSEGQLCNLLYLVKFSYVGQDSLERGWTEALKLAHVFLHSTCVQRNARSRAFPRDSLARVVTSLLAVMPIPPQFEDFIEHSGLKNRDPETFWDPAITNKLQQLQTCLDTVGFQTLGTLTADTVQAEDKIKEFQSGNSIAIPLTSISVSLVQFVAVAGMLNIFIIGYFFILFRRIQGLWKEYTTALNESATEIAQAYFFYWTWRIRSYPIFTFCFSLLLSYISVISFVFSDLIYKSSPQLTVYGPIVSGIFAAVNVVLGVVASRLYYRFHKKVGCS